jgi:hypothetical protein
LAQGKVSLADSAALPRRHWVSNRGRGCAYSNYNSYGYDKHPPLYSTQSQLYRFGPLLPFLPFYLRPVNLHQRSFHALRPADGAGTSDSCIGKRLPTSQKTHAWLEWGTTGGTYILDPTINWAACRADRSGRMSYIPLYAYAGGQKFRAATTSILYAKNQFPAGRRLASRL